MLFGFSSPLLVLQGRLGMWVHSDIGMISINAVVCVVTLWPLEMGSKHKELLSELIISEVDFTISQLPPYNSRL